MVQALRGEKVSLGQLVMNTLSGEYTLSRLEGAYEQFFGRRSVDIAELKGSDPESYDQLLNMLSIRAVSLTEAVADNDGVYRRVMHQIREHMTSE
ncbi:MAG: hypothetical protein K940chlam2_00840 [Chlamydiae bacterium]|nr:hypothetical protein [Chlamydiota bacterium]